MKTRSKGYLVLLTDGEYIGEWVGTNVTVPFAMEDIVFEVREEVVSQVKVSIEVRDGIAYVETI